MTSQTYKLFIKKYPGRDTLDILYDNLVQKYINNPTSLKMIVAIDLQKSITFHDWISSGLETSKIIDT